MAARPRTSLVAGSKTSRVSPDAASAASPLMKSPCSLPVATATETGRYPLIGGRCVVLSWIRDQARGLPNASDGHQSDPNGGGERGDRDVDDRRGSGPHPGPRPPAADAPRRG